MVSDLHRPRPLKTLQPPPVLAIFRAFWCKRLGTFCTNSAIFCHSRSSFSLYKVFASWKSRSDPLEILYIHPAEVFLLCRLTCMFVKWKGRSAAYGACPMDGPCSPPLSCFRSGWRLLFIKVPTMLLEQEFSRTVKCDLARTPSHCLMHCVFLIHIYLSLLCSQCRLPLTKWVVNLSMEEGSVNSVITRAYRMLYLASTQRFSFWLLLLLGCASGREASRA